jgi:two-component system chemotaxis sensor kinase CheA
MHGRGRALPIRALKLLRFRWPVNCTAFPLRGIPAMKSADQAPPKNQVPKVQRDAETIELLGDFVTEGEDGLGRVDEILIEAQRAAVSDEQVNELFRVFHTIKGVSGFLEAHDVTRLAHVTETLMDGARSHQYGLKGKVLDAVFEASAAMRKLLTDVRQAAQNDSAIPQDPELHVLVALIEHATDADAEPAPKGSLRPRSRAAEAAASRAMSRAPAAPSIPVNASAWPARPSLLERASALPAARSLLERVSALPPAQKAPVVEPAVVVPPPTPAATAAAPEAAPAATGEAGGAVRLRETVKVDLERIDSVVEMIGELLIVESMVMSAGEIQSLGSPRIANYLGQLTKISRDLQGVAMRMRMIPVRGVFHRMARLTRDLSRKTGKSVELVQVGEATEMDRSMVERIEEPLVHMIRNAIDHAVESPAERAATNKPELATIRLSAQHEAGSVTIEISDDGRGLRREAILNKARERGLVKDTGERLSDEEVFALIFLPGFSTAAQVSELSGRGVGMDVVKRSIETMRGRVIVRSKPGVGTTFKLVLPLTLAIIDGMLVSCGPETYIIPSLAIVESLQMTPGMLKTVAGRSELLSVRGEVLPLLRLKQLIGLPRDAASTEMGRVVVVESLGKKVGLVVDEVMTQAQIVIKPLSSNLGDTDFFAGAAILADGRVGLILNVDRLGSAVPPLRAPSPPATSLSP